MHGVVNFITYLCIVFSIGMLLVRLFRVVVAERGGLNETKPRSIPVTPGAAAGDVEGLVEMIAMENEGGMTIHEATSE